MTKYEEMEIYVGVSKVLIAYLNNGITRDQCRDLVRQFTNGSDEELDQIIDGGIKVATEQAQRGVANLSRED